MALTNREEFTLLWTKAQPTVSAYISSMVPDFHQAEDVLELVAIILVRKFNTYDRDRPFVNWSIGVARNEVLKHRRKYATDRHVFSDDLVQDISVTYCELSPELDDRRRLLRDCLESVEGRSRRALQMRYFDGLKPAEIADHMQMASGAVRVMLHRIRAVIKQCIESRLNPNEVGS